MSTPVIIELNDVAVSAWRGQELALASPGYALVGATIEALGEAAWSQARLQPRAINNRFWDDLSLEPLPANPGAPVRTPADIACDHLAQVWSALGATPGGGEVLLAVPGFYSRDQLGIVLGMASECAMPVAGMMDAALAAVSRAQPGATVLHLGVYLHRAVVTRFAASERLSRVGAQSARGVGLAQLRERWLKAVAQQFIDTTRFDPLHDAHSEQRLLDTIDSHLADFDRDGRVALEVPTSGASRSATVEGARLEQAVEEQYTRIVELVRAALAPGEAVRLHVAHQAARLPGLQRRLEDLPGVEVVALGADAVRSGVDACAEALRGEGGDGVAYLTQIPWSASSAPSLSAPSAAPSPAQIPTHLLYQGLARPLAERALVIGSQVPAQDETGVVLGAPLSGVSRRHCHITRREDGQAVLVDASSHGTYLNGQRVQGETLLRVGDRLRVGTPGHELQLIGLLEHG
jgi:hypothetical protein